MCGQGADRHEWREDCAARSHPVAPVTKSAPSAALVNAIMKGIAPFIHDLEKQIAALQARVWLTLNSAPEILRRVSALLSYQRGNVVTCHGSVFHASRAVSAERPGATDGWQLMVKHGKDASATATPRAREMGHYSKPRGP
jgi:hypothetical protein